jgi:hypothetical protein
MDIPFAWWALIVVIGLAAIAITGWQLNHPSHK